ncbi:MAG: MATE family efflux transporter [Defluviitaleaceae bacterium]|nr:MATE family efflux transporter [Defluviitaleaceae bacterium]
MLKITDDQRKFLRLLFVVAPPVALQEVLNASVNMVDTLMIGRAMGVTQVTAVGLAHQVTFLFILMSFGIISASGVFSGQYFGKGDIASIHKIMGIGFLGTTLAALLFFVAGFFFSYQVIGIYSDDPLVIEQGAAFLRIISFGYFIHAITITRNSAMRSMRETKIPMVTTAIALGLNLVFNYFVIFVFEMGLAGVAASTLLVRIIELFVQEYFIRRYKVPIKAPIKNYFDFNVKFLKDFFKIGIFIVFNEITWAFGFSIYNIAYGIVGTEAQGSIQLSMAMVGLFQVFGNSLAISTSIIVSNTLGASKNKTATKYARWGLWFGIGTSVIMGGFLAIFAPAIASIYNLPPHVEIYITNILLIASFTMLFRIGNFIMIVGILRSGGDTKWCFYLEMITMYLVGLPLAFFGAIMGMSIYIVFLMAMCEEVVKFLVALRRVLSDKWANTIV